ncbi:unnamed protein product [Closterium sp. Yama58-4]|nr:unnamed protein product [Closterium sp. Yama58-4]
MEHRRRDLRKISSAIRLAASLASLALVAVILLTATTSGAASDSTSDESCEPGPPTSSISVVSFAGQATGDSQELFFEGSMCVNPHKFREDMILQVDWNGGDPTACRSVALYPKKNCAGRPYRSLIRPLTADPIVNWNFRVDELPASLTITFSPSLPLPFCLPPPCLSRPHAHVLTAACSPPCREAATCQVDNGVAMCKCGAGYTMMANGHCKAVCKPACATNAECVVVGGNSVCQCKQGYALKGKRCMPQAGVGQAREWLNHQIRGARKTSEGFTG